MEIGSCTRPHQPPSPDATLREPVGRPTESPPPPLSLPEGYPNPQQESVLALDQRAYYCAENLVKARTRVSGISKYLAGKIAERRFRIALNPKVNCATDEFLRRWTDITEQSSMRLMEAWKQCSERYVAHCERELRDMVEQINARSPGAAKTAEHYALLHKDLEKERCEQWQEKYLCDLDEYGAVISRAPYMALFFGKNHRDSVGDCEDDPDR